MEFKFAKDIWERNVRLESKDFSIITEQGNKLFVPDFIQTRRKQFKQKRGVHHTSSFYRNILPRLTVGKNHHHLRSHYLCNLFTGKWRRARLSASKQSFLWLLKKLRKFDKECLQRRLKVKETIKEVFPKELQSMICSFVTSEK